MKPYINRLVMFAALAAIAVASVLAQQSRTQRSGGDFKITEKTSVAGQSFQSTTMIKGARERTETHMGIDLVNVTQCDLKQKLQINDQARKYLITPMDTGDASDASMSAMSGKSSGPSTRGGVVTYIVNTTDTGERKEMFGFTARHLKSSMTTESSPDACNKQDMKIERDGWYIDLSYEFSCGFDQPPQMNMAGRGGGCQDRIRFRNTGGGKLGYPVMETTTMYGQGGTQTITKEVLELSRAPLDAALFDVPVGYTQARSQQEMFGMPSMGDMMSAQQGGRRTDDEDRPSMSRPERPSVDGGSMSSGRVRVGVVEINNKANATISIDELRERLIGQLNSSGLDAVALNASSLSEAQTEARVKHCDYILLTDLSSLKAASAGKKIGGLLGRATGVDTGSTGKSEARLDFKLFPAGSSSAKLDTSAVGKEDGNDASVAAALDRETKAVVAAARKN